MPVVSMGHRIDNGLGDHRPGDLELYRCLHVRCPCAHTAVNLAEDKFHGLIDHFKQPSGIGLLGGDGFAFFRSMKMETMHLDVIEKPLRILPEKEHGGVCGPTIPQQIEIMKNRF